MQTHALHLGGKLDVRDERDQPFKPTTASVPSSVDLTPLVASVYNQMPMQMSCSANAIAATFEMVANIEQRSIAAPSRLFLYYNARVRDGWPDKDQGASIRDAIKAAADPGTCPETLWPYDPANVCSKPSDAAYGATTECVASYFRIDQKIDDLKACIAEGYPFIFGMQVFADQFIAAKTSGHYEAPANGETAVGGHAVVALGYDDANFTILNSLGTTWGRNGYFTMPYAYFQNPDWTYDFWTIRSLK